MGDAAAPVVSTRIFQMNLRVDDELLATPQGTIVSDGEKHRLLNPVEKLLTI